MRNNRIEVQLPKQIEYLEGQIGNLLQDSDAIMEALYPKKQYLQEINGLAQDLELFQEQYCQDRSMEDVLCSLGAPQHSKVELSVEQKKLEVNITTPLRIGKKSCELLLTLHLTIERKGGDTASLFSMEILHHNGEVATGN